MQSELLKVLIEKFPTFDPNWPVEGRAAWFEGFQQLLKMVSGEEPADSETAGAVPPAAVYVAEMQPGRTTPKKLSPEQRTEIKRLAAEGLSNKAIVEKLGTPRASTNLYATQGRQAARERNEVRAVPAGGFPVNGNGHHDAAGH